MAHEEIHINIGLRGYKSCICMCKDCYSPDGQCTCSGCTCKTKGSLAPLHSAYYHEPKPIVSHPCTPCGKEVTRKSNKGRWPTKCVECR